jgi:hypothetical protein
VSGSCGNLLSDEGLAPVAYPRMPALSADYPLPRKDQKSARGPDRGNRAGSSVLACLAPEPVVSRRSRDPSPAPSSLLGFGRGGSAILRSARAVSAIWLYETFVAE